MEAVLHGPTHSVNNVYKSKAHAHKDLAKMFRRQFNVSLSGLQIKNKIVTMRRQYSKALAFKKKFDDGTRCPAELKERIRAQCSFFDIVNDLWCTSCSFRPKSPVRSISEGLSADEAYDSDEDGSTQRLSLSPRLTPQQKRNYVSREPVLRGIVKEKPRSRRSNRNVAVLEELQDEARRLQKAHDRIRRYEIERDHKAAMDRLKREQDMIQANLDAELERIKLERIKLERRVVQEQLRSGEQFGQLVTLLLESLGKKDDRDSKRRRMDA
ncbi:hypothetical protein EC968_000126 [Mortierella alpina]|nr:hypothetical protein EC968_000126 [Mortierella alpina]